ncbi:MAG: ABC transporter permease [Chloroflexi bacterium]|nr:ABC transporter permease [Chloroflexota bacterium]MCC6891675.1 ABC transporter permease [Anaerolineae bacterium]
MLQETVAPPARTAGLKVNPTLVLLGALIVMCLVIGSRAPTFLSMNNVVTIASTLAAVGISAIGMTIVLITGGVDLSVGSVAALTGVVASSLWPSTLPIWPAVGVALLSGLLVGLLNGFIITRLRINPLITTLATYSAVRGIAFVVSGTQDNQLGEPSFQFLGRGNIAGVPFSLILMLALYLIFALVLRYTRFGRNLFAIGGSPDAARLAGIHMNRHLLIAYGLCGLLSALSGIVSASQLAAGRPQSAFGLEFAVIAAVVLGGTTLVGGKGTLLGTLIGVILLRTLDNGLIQLNVSAFWQDVARGVVLLLAVGVDQIRIKWEQTRQGGGSK